MSVIKIQTPQNVTLSFNLANVAERMVAALIDLLILGIPSIILLTIVANENSHDPEFVSSVKFLVLIPWYLYDLFFEYFMKGQSPGKMLFKMRVTTEDGGKPSLSQLMVRNSLRIVDMRSLTILFMFTGVSLGIVGVFPIPIVALLVAAFSGKDQRLGDMAAGTIVVKLTQSATLSDTVFQEVEKNYVPKYRNVLTLSDNDLRAIKEAVVLAERYNNSTFALDVAVKVKNYLGVTEKVKAVQFLRVILKDYNYLANKEDSDSRML